MRHLLLSSIGPGWECLRNSMSNRHIDRLYLKEPLSSIWDSVEDMAANDVEELHRLFLKQHVREDFAKRFPIALDRERKIGQRFFRKHIQSEHTQTKMHHQGILDILGSRDSKDLKTEVIWGAGKDTIGFLLTGSPHLKTVDSIFIDEGHALARVSQGNRKYFLFLAHGDALFTFPCSIGQST